MAKKLTDEQLNMTITVNGDDSKKKLGELEKNYRDLRTTQEDLRKAKQKLIAEGKKETDAYKSIESELKKTKVAMDANKDSQKEMREEIGLTGLTMSQLEKIQRDLSRQIKSGTTKGTEDYDRLKKELQEVNKVITEQRNDLRGTADSMGDTAEAGEQLSGALSDVFQGLSSGNMQQAAAGFTVLKNSIAATGKAALALVATPWGATLTALAGIGLIARQWFNYNVAISETIKLTEQLTEFEGRRLSQYRASVQATAETFDKEFNEVLRAANSLSKQMGIDQEEALELIQQGFVRGADASGNFLDNLQEYPTQFKNAGFSAQDFIDITTQEAKGGTYADKLVDSLKEADLSLREQTTSTRDAIVNAFGAPFADQILDRVKSGELTTKQALIEIAKQSERTSLSQQQQAQLTADIFRGAGEDAGGFLQVMHQVNEAFSEENRILTENEIATQRLVDANVEYEKALADLFDSSKSGFPAMLSNLKSIGTEISTNILSGLKQMFTSIEQLKMQAGLEGQSDAVRDMVENAKLFGTTAAEEAEIQMEATRNNINRIKEDIEDLSWWQSGTALKESLAEQEAYYKELVAIAKNESVALQEYEENLKNSGTPVTVDSDNNSSGGDDSDTAKKEREAWKKKENDLTQLIESKRKERLLNQKTGFEKEMAQIDSKYAREIEKAEGHSDRIKELEELRDLEKNDLRLRREKEYLERSAEMELENQKLKDEAEMEREVAAQETQLEKDELRLEYARSIALRELEIMEEAELAKVEAVEGAEILKQQIRENFSLQASKLNREFDKQEQNLKQDQVKWSEKTEQEKLNAITGGVSLAAKAFNEGSDAWKAAKIAETIIATQQAAVNAYSSLAGIPVVGPALGAAAAAAAVIAGKKNVQAIIKTPLNKMPEPKKGRVRGYEDGLYPDKVNVTRTDGRRFKARNKARSGTEIVREPTYFHNNGGFITGESGPELIVDADVFRQLDPSVIDHILNVRQNVRGFETGMYPRTETQTPETPQMNTERLEAVLDLLTVRLEEPIRTYTVYGYDDEENRQRLQQEIDQSRQNGNLTP